MIYNYIWILVLICLIIYHYYVTFWDFLDLLIVLDIDDEFFSFFLLFKWFVGISTIFVIQVFLFCKLILKVNIWCLINHLFMPQFASYISSCSSNSSKDWPDQQSQPANLYDGFFWPKSRALLPTFRTNCPDGVSFCPDFHPQPLFFTQPSHWLTHPLLGYVHT